MGLSRSGDHCTAASVRIIAQEKSCWRALWRVSAGRRSWAIGGDPHQPGAVAPSAFLLRSTRSPPLDPVREGRVPIRRADGRDTRDVLGARKGAPATHESQQSTNSRGASQAHGAVIHSSAAYAVGVVQICWLRRGINLCMRGRGAPAALLSCLFVVARNGQVFS